MSTLDKTRIIQEGVVAAQLVGQVVRARLPSKRRIDAEFAALVINHRYIWGKWHVQVIPLIGIGDCWLNLYSVIEEPAYERFINQHAMDDLQTRANACGSELEPSSEPGA